MPATGERNRQPPHRYARRASWLLGASRSGRGGARSGPRRPEEASVASPDVAEVCPRLPLPPGSVPATPRRRRSHQAPSRAQQGLDGAAPSAAILEEPELGRGPRAPPLGTAGRRRERPDQGRRWPDPAKGNQAGASRAGERMASRRKKYGCSRLKLERKSGGEVAKTGRRMVTGFGATAAAAAARRSAPAASAGGSCWRGVFWWGQTC